MFAWKGDAGRAIRPFQYEFTSMVSNSAHLMQATQTACAVTDHGQIPKRDWLPGEPATPGRFLTRLVENLVYTVAHLTQQIQI